MMNDLERSYRRLLIVLPPSYRDRMGDDIVATLLAGHQPHERRPRPREVLALIRTGLTMRLARGDDPSRYRAWRLAGAVSVALIVYSAVLVTGINLRGDWTSAVPLALVPMWGLLVLVSCAPLASHRARRLGPLLAPMWIIAFVVASRWLLAPRSLVVALALCSLIVLAARGASAWVTVVSCAIGALVGGLGANHVVERLDRVAIPRPRGVMYVGFVFEWPSGTFEYICITALVVILVLGFIRPSVALASSVCVVPVMLVVQISTDRYQLYDYDLSAGFGIAAAVAAFLVLGLAIAAIRDPSRIDSSADAT
jgi:hypothetical protein